MTHVNEQRRYRESQAEGLSSRLTMYRAYNVKVRRLEKLFMSRLNLLIFHRQ